MVDFRGDGNPNASASDGQQKNYDRGLANVSYFFEQLSKLIEIVGKNWNTLFHNEKGVAADTLKKTWDAVPEDQKPWSLASLGGSKVDKPGNLVDTGDNPLLDSYLSSIKGISDKEQTEGSKLGALYNSPQLNIPKQPITSLGPN